MAGKIRSLWALGLVFGCISCFSGSPENQIQGNKVTIQNQGMTIERRFNCPAGFSRQPETRNSFADYLRNLPLKPVGAKVHLYNGSLKKNNVYDAVVDMEIGDRDLQQCADAVMRLRGEYLFAQKRYKDISFNFNSGFSCDYQHWMDGYRVIIKGNNAGWEKAAKPLNTYQSFRKYMDVVFSYAGTLSLSKALKFKSISDMKIGDVFIKGGTPGHAVIVVDMAKDSAGHKAFMLAQSYMPAQDIQILKNENNPAASPWYFVNDIKKVLETPEWEFGKDELKGW